MRLRAGSIVSRQAAKRYHSPGEIQKQNKHDRRRAYFTFENDTSERKLNYLNATFFWQRKRLLNAFCHKTPKAKPSLYTHISEASWGLIEDEEQARTEGNTDDERRQQRLDMAKQAEHVNQNWEFQKLGDITDRRECWKNNSFEKATFTPNFLTG